MEKNSESENNMLPRIQEISLADEKLIEQRIVWLLGSRRSGTTWLGEQLLSYNTYYLHEPDITAHLDIPMSQSGVNFKRRIDARRKIDGYFFSERYQNTWSYYLGKLMLYRIYAQVVDSQNIANSENNLKEPNTKIKNFDLKKRIIVKEPSTMLDASDIISQSMPDSKIIIMIRDGRDIIDSFVDARSSGGWQAKNPDSILKQDQRIPFIQRRSKLWINQTENLLKAYNNHNEKLRCLVKYEELMKNTFDNLKKIYDFMGINISDNQLIAIVEKFDFNRIPEKEKGPGKRNRIASPGKWRENFSENEKNIMNEILMPILKKIGYE